MLKTIRYFHYLTYWGVEVRREDDRVDRGPEMFWQGSITLTMTSFSITDHLLGGMQSGSAVKASCSQQSSLPIPVYVRYQ